MPKADAQNYELEEINNVSYMEDEAIASELTKVNILIPKGVENPPVLMWIGGGAWAYVNRHQEMAVCRKMAKEGIAVISVGHRLSPARLRGEQGEQKGKIKHPEHIKDVAQAFKWVREQSEKYGYDQDNIFVGGFSSGGHLAALLACDKRYLEALGLSTSMIKAIIPVAGGYDIPQYRKDLIKEDPSYEQNHINPVFGDTHEEHVDASPMTYLEDFDTPMLMISEGENYQYSIVFELKLQEIGYRKFQVINAYNETHASLWKDMSFAEESMYRDYVVAYIRAMSLK